MPDNAKVSKMQISILSNILYTSQAKTRSSYSGLLGPGFDAENDDLMLTSFAKALFIKSFVKERWT